jgi:hypothetical protein
LPLLATAATIDEEVEQHIAIFRGDKWQHPSAAEGLAWKGLSDPRLYDVIEERLRNDYPVPREAKRERQRLAWYIRALGFSGQDKYVPTLQRFLDDRDYNSYARHALKDLPDYRNWNPIISDRKSFDPKLSDQANRILNMLRATDFRLKEIGAKRVYFERPEEPAVLDALVKELLAAYQGADSSNNDEIAWMIKALGATRNEKYRPVVQEVADKALDAKIARHARTALDAFPKR